MKKTVLITGASGNLGKATVDRFLNNNYQVIITVTPGKKKSTPPQDFVDIFEADLTNEKNSIEVIDAIASRYERLDSAILLVGGFAAGGINDTGLEGIKQMFALNFDTAYTIARPAFLQMKKQKSGGRIVLIGSRPVLNPNEGKNVLAYGLSKSLLFKLAEYLNAEGASSNIVTSVVVPGVIDTPENRNAMPAGNFEQWVSPQDIASTLALLCSDKANSFRDPIIKVYGNS